jgi:hypothetical protein
MTSHMGKRGLYILNYTLGQRLLMMTSSIGKRDSRMGKRFHTWAKGVYMGKICVLTVGQFHVYYPMYRRSVSHYIS